MLINIVLSFFACLTIFQFIKASFKTHSKERELEAKRYFEGSLSNGDQDSTFGLALHFKDGAYRFSKQTKNRPIYILGN